MVSFAAADFKDMQGFINEVEDAMREFGIYMYMDPNLVDGDTYGYIFSDTEMDEEELQAVSDDQWLGDSSAHEEDEDRRTPEEIDRDELNY